MRLLVCGARTWTDRETMRRALNAIHPRPIVIIHGAARGADSLAGEIAKTARVAVVEFPADWQGDGRAAGPIRNQRMLTEGKPDRCLAFGPLWRSPGRVSGTGDMVTRCLRAGLPVRWVSEPGAEAVELREMPAQPSKGG